MDEKSGVSDGQALINALTRACMEREKLEIAVQNLLVENQRLAARVTELESAASAPAKENTKET